MFHSSAQHDWRKCLLHYPPAIAADPTQLLQLTVQQPFVTNGIQSSIKAGVKEGESSYFMNEMQNKCGISVYIIDVKCI